MKKTIIKPFAISFCIYFKFCHVKTRLINANCCCDPTTNNNVKKHEPNWKNSLILLLRSFTIRVSINSVAWQMILHILKLIFHRTNVHEHTIEILTPFIATHSPLYRNTQINCANVTNLDFIATVWINT